MKLRKVLVLAVIAILSLTGCPDNGSATSGNPNTVATPTASQLEGRYNGTQHISLSCQTAGASIYYTLDGSPPAANSSLYASPIPISATSVLKAVAVKEGMTNSGILSAEYSIFPREFMIPLDDYESITVIDTRTDFTNQDLGELDLIEKLELLFTHEYVMSSANYAAIVSRGLTIIVEEDAEYQDGYNFGAYSGNQIGFNLDYLITVSDLAYLLNRIRIVQTFFNMTLLSYDDNPGSHIHEWGNWTITTEPTATTPGIETRVCTLNPEHKETRAIPQLLFNNIADLAASLAALKYNTADTPYTVALNVDDITGIKAAIPLYIYVSLDLSGSTFTDIGNAFNQCRELAGITLPNSVTSIGYQAFYNCPLVSITIPGGVTSIGEQAFRGCSSLTSITIPNSVTSIGSGAFYSCNNLAGITLPNSVTSIGYEAFYNCTSLASVTIPDGVTSIGSGAFYNCTSLAVIEVGGSNTAYCSLEGVLYNKTQSTLIQYPAKKTSTSFTIPDGVTSISVAAFYGCASLASVTIPNSVTSIGGSVFYRCYSLANVTIPDGVTSIGYEAFYDCASLASVTIPNSVTSIGNRAFYSCNNLASVTIPNSVTSIGNYAFQNCASLASVTVMRSVVTHGNITALASNVFRYTHESLHIKVPADSVSDYKTAANWSTYASRIEAITP